MFGKKISANAAKPFEVDSFTPRRCDLYWVFSDSRNSVSLRVMNCYPAFHCFCDDWARRRMSCLTFDSLNAIARRVRPTHNRCLSLCSRRYVVSCYPWNGFSRKAFNWSLINRSLRTSSGVLMALLIDCHAAHAFEISTANSNLHKSHVEVQQMCARTTKAQWVWVFRDLTSTNQPTVQ